MYGTLVDADGQSRHLSPDAFTVEVTEHWTSSRTGATYPAAWRVTVPAEDLMIELEPTVADQSSDTRATTGVIYWEGSQDVRATRRGATLGGEAYIELTGYEGWRGTLTAPRTRSRSLRADPQYCGYAPRTDAARRLCRPGRCSRSLPTTASVG